MKKMRNHIISMNTLNEIGLLNISKLKPGGHKKMNC